MRNLLAILLLALSVQSEVPKLKVGYVGHDHQSALYVAIENAPRTKKEAHIYLKEVQKKKHYDLMQNDKKIAEVELVKAGGGSKMPSAMAQGQFDIGLGGVPAIAFFNDKGSPMKVISPLQIKGDMLVVRNDLPVSNWDEFIALLKKGEKQLRIGFKSPKAVAKIIFERALKEEGITYTTNKRDSKAAVLMVNLKGGTQMNPGLQNGLVDGYVMNTPAPVIAEDKGLGKIVADLNLLPPGLYVDHPCCAIGANNTYVQENREVVKTLLKLIILATNYINEDTDKSAEQVGSFIGTSKEVEIISMNASGYTTNPDAYYKKTLSVWMDDMNDMGYLKGKLKGKRNSAAIAQLCDFSLLEEAALELKEQGLEIRY